MHYEHTFNVWCISWDKRKLGCAGPRAVLDGRSSSANHQTTNINSLQSSTCSPSSLQLPNDFPWTLNDIDPDLAPKTRVRMFFDDRVFGLNATDESRDQWARERWKGVQLLWAFMIILHFAALLHIDPLVLHFLSVMFKLMPGSSDPLVSDHTLML